ncbi:uncharacterized protein LOC128729048 [Anopheles nili]|uniref:uncharacterized protein LOC128729048 n=1 Tax=Anopheles nili TaxID=185578 RepID=UPI00237BBEBD|nr:uncharacterized protein LOC128729048 [Anopheles nili]
MIEAVFCGPSKPNDTEQYMWPFVMEINTLQHDGININGCSILVKLRAVIADTPARSFIKAPTPLTDWLNFDIIQDVIVADRMYLIDLGVTKK